MSVVILSYYDSVVRLSDIDILLSNGWLTDSIIGFYLQYLEMEIYNGDKFLFVSPEVVQCIKSSHSSEVQIFLEPLSAQNYSVIFFPLNDHDNAVKPGGSHWSLLVYFRGDGTFYHFDSSKHSNSLPASKLVSNLCYYLTGIQNVDYDERRTLQQNNGYDCGVHVLCNVDNIAEHVKTHGNLKNLSLVSEDTVNNKRNCILALIETLQCKETDQLQK